MISLIWLFTRIIFYNKTIVGAFMPKAGISKKFQKKTENFICEVCSTKVMGNGYTNHCPKCLHSKHVDINPGDRKATCHGIMKPDSFESKSNQLRIIHVCNKCGHIKKNKISDNDDMENIHEIMSKNIQI